MVRMLSRLPPCSLTRVVAAEEEGGEATLEYPLCQEEPQPEPDPEEEGGEGEDASQAGSKAGSTKPTPR